MNNTITNLFDAFSKNEVLTKEFGFGSIIRYQGKTILFDAGSNANIFQKNIETLNINLNSVDIAIVSHAHFDHLNGIDYLLKINPNVKIYFPEDFFWGSPCPFDATGTEPDSTEHLPKHMRYFDGEKTKFLINQSGGRFLNANIEFIKNNTEILPGVTLITTESDYMGYFSKYPGKTFVPGQFQNTESEAKLSKLQELSLCLQTDEGDTLLVGCSHSSIEVILDKTVAHTSRPIKLLYGGLHLIPFNREQLSQIISHIKDKIQVRQVAPTHCTGHLAFQMLQETYQENYLYAGLGETTNF